MSIESQITELTAAIVRLTDVMLSKAEEGTHDAVQGVEGAATKRKRRTPAEMAADVARAAAVPEPSTPAIANIPETEPEMEEGLAESAITMDDLIADFRLLLALDRDAAKAIVDKHGVAKLTLLEPSQFAAAALDINKALVAANND